MKIPLGLETSRRKRRKEKEKGEFGALEIVGPLKHLRVVVKALASFLLPKS